jgi:hypothetical protein
LLMIAVAIVTTTALWSAPDPTVRVVVPEEESPPPEPRAAEVVVSPREVPPPRAPAVEVERKRRPPKVERERKRKPAISAKDPERRIAQALQERGLRREDVRHLEGASDLAAEIERVTIDAAMLEKRLDRLLGKLRRLGNQDAARVVSLEAMYLDLRKRAAQDRSARPERMMEAEALERRIDTALSR